MNQVVVESWIGSMEVGSTSDAMASSEDGSGTHILTCDFTRQ